MSSSHQSIYFGIIIWKILRSIMLGQPRKARILLGIICCRKCIGLIRYSCGLKVWVMENVQVICGRISGQENYGELVLIRLVTWMWPWLLIAPGKFLRFGMRLWGMLDSAGLPRRSLWLGLTLSVKTSTRYLVTMSVVAWLFLLKLAILKLFTTIQSTNARNNSNYQCLRLQPKCRSIPRGNSVKSYDQESSRTDGLTTIVNKKILAYSYHLGMKINWDISCHIR